MTRISTGLDNAARTQLEAWAAAVCGERHTLAVDQAGGTAQSALEALDGGQWEAVSWLTAFARGTVEDGAVARLARAAGSGVVVALAIPGDALGPADVREIADAIGGVVAAQHVVEGVVIADADGRVDAGLPRSPGVPHVWLVAAGASSVAVPEPTWRDAREAWTHVSRLERANETLARANARLARTTIARYDSAAAAFVGRAERRVVQLEAEVAELRRRLDQEIEAAKRNDDYFQAARAKLHEPHHRVAEGAHRRLARLRRPRNPSG